MARNVTLIPARSSQSTAENLQPKKIRMAAYCRVSTDQEDQVSSFEAQCTYYTAYISNNPEYDLAGIYADEGISGTNTKKRDQFNKMIEDCKAGKIDVIITKSISRFARNTLDCLNFVRLLKDMGIGIIFEKENIHTLDGKGELLITVLASLAQEESFSTSLSTKWGLQRRFEQGKLQINTTKFLGYDKDEDGNLIINEEQAKVVKRIYYDYLNGKGPNRIAKELEEEGVKNWNGQAKWYVSTVSKILKNEKYKGDALLQKTYTVDFLSKKRATNNGEVPRYYVEDSHPGIIDKDMWEAVQLETERRKAYAKKHGIVRLDYAKADNPLAGKVICGECGSLMGRKVWNSTDKKLRRVIWQCNHKYEVKGKVLCENRHVDGTLLQAGIKGAINQITENRDFYRRIWEREADDCNPLTRHHATKLLHFLEDGNESEVFEEIFSGVIRFIEISIASLAVTLIEETRLEITIE